MITLLSNFYFFLAIVSKNVNVLWEVSPKFKMFQVVGDENESRTD
jgi:hypothetical protein